MATVTVQTTEVPQPPVVTRTVTVVMPEAEAQAVAARLQQAPAVVGSGGEIGLQIQLALA